MNKSKFWDAVSEANSIAIAGHIRPDGDCIGSCMGITRYLRSVYPEKTITVYLEYMPKSFAYLFQADEYEVGFEHLKQADLFIAMDCSDAERLGDSYTLFEQAEDTVCIDHHISNVGYAKYNFIAPKASSASEVLFEILDEDKLNKDIATAIYLGMVHDSGVFKYSNTSRRTMEIAGVLIEKGVETTDLIDKTFYSKTYKQNQILGRVLMESILALDGKVVIGCISQKVEAFYEATSEDYEGIVEQMRITQGVEVAIFLHETSPMVYKVSMRANDMVDVSKIATMFGGGGHIKAAGCSMSGSYYDVVNALLEQINNQLQIC